MIERHYYECEICGAHFEDVAECAMHEMEHSFEAYKNGYCCFDGMGHLMKPDTSNLEDVYYLEVNSKEAYYFLLQAFDDYSILKNPLRSISKENLPVKLYWNDETYKWRELNCEQQKLNSIRDIFKKE